MSFTVIRNLLENKLKAWNANSGKNLPIAFENVPFAKPDITATYLECYIVQTSPMNKTTLCNRITYSGFMQVNICIKKGIGTKQAEDIANLLSQEFSVLPKLGKLSFETPLCVEGNFTNGDYLTVPTRVFFRYESF